MGRVCGIFAALGLLGNGVTAGAQSLSDDLHHCEVFEHSLLVSDRMSALQEEARSALKRFDRSQALRPDAVRATGANSRHCNEVLETLASPGVTDAELSPILSMFPVLVVLNTGLQTPLRIYAHVPDLAYWAGQPIVKIAQFDQHSGSETQLAETIGEQIRAAADFATALRHFLSGDRAAASATRPPPDALPPLARAWLTGIPLAFKREAFVGTSLEPVYDELSRKSGDNAYAVLANVASGAISPVSALRLSVQANNVHVLALQASMRTNYVGPALSRVSGE